MSSNLMLLVHLAIANWPTAPVTSASPFSLYSQLWSAVISLSDKSSYLLLNNKINFQIQTQFHVKNDIDLPMSFFFLQHFSQNHHYLFIISKFQLRNCKLQFMNQLFINYSLQIVNYNYKVRLLFFLFIVATDSNLPFPETSYLYRFINLL